MKRSVFLLIFGFTASLLLFGQEKINRTLYLFPTEGTTERGREKQELLEIRASAFDEYLKVVIAESGVVLLTPAEEESDCLIRTVITENAEGIHTISVFAYDSFFEKDAFKLTAETEGFSLLPLRDSLFQDLTAEILKAFPPRDPEVVEVVTETIVEDVQVKKVFIEGEGVTLTVRGLPGTRISSSGGENYTIDEEGFIEIGLPAGITFFIEAEKEGYFPLSAEFLTEDEDITYTLDQVKSGRFVLDARSRFSDMTICPGFQYFVKPHYGFISFYLDENLLGLSSLINGIGGYQIIPYVYPVLSGGWYFRQPQKNFRIALSLGVFTKLVFPFDAPPYVSKDMRFGIQPALNFDWSPFKKLRFYFEWAPRFYYSKDNTLAINSEISFSDRYGVSGIDYPGAFDLFNQAGIYLPVFFLGVRYIL